MRLVIFHGVEVFFERFVSHRLNKKTRIVKFIAYDLLELIEKVAILRHYCNITWTYKIVAAQELI